MAENPVNSVIVLNIVLDTTSGKLRYIKQKTFKQTRFIAILLINRAKYLEKMDDGNQMQQKMSVGKEQGHILYLEVKMHCKVNFRLW